MPAFSQCRRWYGGRAQHNVKVPLRLHYQRVPIHTVTTLSTDNPETRQNPFPVQWGPEFFILWTVCIGLYLGMGGEHWRLSTEFGGNGQYFTNQISEWPFLGKNFISRPNISDGLFYRSLYTLSVSAVLNTNGLPFLAETFYLTARNSSWRFFVSSYFASHPITVAYFSKYWGTDAWAVLPPQILRGRPPSPPKSPPVYLGNRWH